MAVTQDGFFEAASRGDDDYIIECLTEPSIDFNARDIDGDTALYRAASLGREDTVKILLIGGADPNIFGPLGPPLCIAVGRDDKKIVEQLIDAGADLNGGGNGTAHIPLNIAIKYNNDSDIANLLINRGADVNAICVVQGYEETPLMGAALRGNEEIVKKLLDHGADARMTDNEGDGPLAYLVLGRNLNTNIAKMLLLHGADIDDLYSKGYRFMRLTRNGATSYSKEAVNHRLLKDEDVVLSWLNPNGF